MPVPTPISAIVLTKNEEEDLPDCLASLAWADEVLVVDSFSTDRTVEIAEQLATRVVQHPFKNYAAQRNVAQQQARHDWVLHIDADERVSPELRDEIQALARTDKLSLYNGYHIQRVHLFSGRWFPDPHTRRITPKLHRSLRRLEVPRLFNRTVVNWERALHEEARVPEPRGVLNGMIYHYSTTNLSRAYETLNYYSDLEAAYLHRTRTRASMAEAVFRGTRSFIYHYFYTRLYRYGDQGLVLAALHGYGKFLMYAKLSERIRIQNKRGVWTARDHRLLSQFDVQANDE